MKWRFTLIDRQNNNIPIEEPVGWDGTEIIIKRDGDSHGIVFNYQGNEFEYVGEGRKRIKREYERYGIDGKMTLVIEQGCNEGNYEELYRGRLVFARYQEVAGDECHVKIPIEMTSDVMTLQNRWDQKADLLAAKAFDGITDLPAYDRLGFPLTLPSKTVLLQDYALNTIVNKTPVDVGVDGEPAPPYDMGMIEIAADKSIASEVGMFSVNSQPLHRTVDNNLDDLSAFSIPSGSVPDGIQHSKVNVLDLSPIVNYAQGTLNYGIVSRCDLDIHLKGKITVRNSTGMNFVRWALCRLPEGPTGENYSDFEWLALEDVYCEVTPAGFAVPDDVIDLERTYHDPNFVLNRGDRLYCFYTVYVERDYGMPGTPAYDLEFSPDSYFRLKALTTTPPSDAKAFMINEALSRVTESITEGRMRAYSEYFGRTDSQPYSVDTDGPGSRAAITKGLFIRRLDNRNGVPLPMALSLKDLFDGLDPIHHIGYGIEADPERPGHLRLRVEDWRYFYKSDIALNCPNVDRIDRKTIENEHYSTYKFGYEKWEAEEYTGLDEFLTKRSYRTTTNQVRNEFSRLSKFVASGYALEITRRKDSESKDWRYDNEIFIICLAPGSTLSGQPFFGEFTDVGISIAQMGPGDPAPLATDYVVGTVITVAGSASNDGNFTVVSVTQISPTTVYIIVQETVTPESFAAIDLGVSTASNYHVELGHIASAANILEPDTVYNFRLSPVRCALRWLDKVLATYRKSGYASKVLFMDGDGNYQAAGELDSTFAKNEAGVMSEQGELRKTVLADPEQGVPLLRPERDEYDYPMTVKQFKALLRNPYIKVRYGNESITSVGWIDEVKYRPEEGKATFVIIPGYEISQADIQFMLGLTTEGDGLFITTEDNQIITTE
jgi:hypothetical protein